MVPPLFEPSGHFPVTDTYAGPSIIPATVRKDGYLEGNGWRVSWCVGHLAGLADADSYDPKYAKWRYDDLPILPEHWQMVVGKDKKKQFDILKKLMNAPDVTEVVKPSLMAESSIEEIQSLFIGFWQPASS